MANWSFLQSTFLGGIWSPQSQGNMHAPAYKTAVNISANAYPVEEGTWLRRQGVRWLGPTRNGNKGRVISFDFSVTQPYQMEFTDGYLRLYAGLALVTALPLDVLSIVPTNPVKIITAEAHGLSTGASVKFTLNQNPAPVPDLANRQFLITKVDNYSFTLVDAVTGVAVDGTAWNYTIGSTNDQVAKIFELVTPYTNGDWENVRTVSGETSVILLHPNHPPQLLSQTGGTPNAPFTLVALTFLDGPYLDINPTTTTLTPSGTSGSITLTASSTTGINNGTGFVSTDVGRLIRIQGGPPVWAVGTTYNQNDVVTGADSNVYQSLVKGNIAHDPTIDGGVNWQLGTTGVTWTWGVITAVGSTTSVTFTINGPALVNTDATPVWRIGTFTNTISTTSGWPSSGCYHEGRLWLTGAVANRIDGGTSNNVNTVTNAAVADGSFNFEPTGSDGTVADDNAVAAILNATEVNAIFWMASDPAGLILGTQAGEWLVRASQLDDPITPTSIQARRFSTYGCANIEPIRASRELIFVQRQQRKIMELGNYPYGEVAGYYAPNMAKFAENLTVGGIEEIRWQQEQVPIVWGRRADGQLVGVTYKHAPASGMGTADTFTAWHGPHALGSGRLVESISTGPSYDGLSQSLYLVSAPANGVGARFVEVLTPLFDDALPDWASNFVDGCSAPATARKFLVSNGDAFNGVRIYGLTYMNGQTLSMVMGGLDLGDYAVANGYVTLTFGTPATFTESFFNAFNDGTAYGPMGGTATITTVVAGAAAPYSVSTIGSWVNASETHGNFAFADIYNRSTLVGVNSQDDTFDIFDYNTFALSSSTSLSGIFGSLTFEAADFAIHSNGYAYAMGDANTLVKISLSGTPSITATLATGDETTDFPDARLFLPLEGPGNYMAVVAVSSVSTQNKLYVFDADTMQFIPNSHTQIAQDDAKFCVGPYSNDFAEFYVLGRYAANSYSSGDTVTFYKAAVIQGSDTVGYVSLGTLAPSAIDATWTTFYQVRGPIYDQTDGTIVFAATCTDSVTNTSYMIKMNPHTMAIVWKTAIPDTVAVDPSVTSRKTPFRAFYGVYQSGSSSHFYRFELDTGAVTTYQFQPVFLDDGIDFYDEADGALVCFAPQWAWSVNPAFLGTWSNAHGASGNSNKASKLYFGNSFGGSPTTTYQTYQFPSSVGYTYTSEGQLLRPDFGDDAGTRMGPAFGKKRRIHSASFGLYRTQGMSVGTDFSHLVPLRLTAADETTPVSPPTLYSGICWQTLDASYDFTNQICWQVSRPYPAMIQAIEGYLSSADK